MSNWVNQIAETIDRKKLFRRGEHVLVAVSGGLDSMVLLRLLHQLSAARQWKITVTHFNHRLRGRSSDADENLVRKTAAKLKLKFVVGRGDVKTFARQNGVSIEMAARTLRHEFLARTAKKIRINTIALAHHADDQVELFFLRLLRGAGTEGLAGMGWDSRSPAASSIRLVRPLLDQTKECLRDYATAECIPFREDASNAQPDFLRNRIRNEVIPVLQSIQPSLNETILRTMEIAVVDANFIVAAALDWLASKKRPPLDQLHIAVQRVCVRLQLRALGVPADFDLVEQIRLHPDLLMSVQPKVAVHRDSTGTVYRKVQTTVSFQGGERKVDLRRPGRIQFGGIEISWAVVKAKGDRIQREARRECFDARKVGPRILLRHWKPGDRFQMSGAFSAKKLQDIFTNLKISQAEKHRRIVATTEAGEIFWVEGLRISERFKLDNHSIRRLKWVWQCGEPSVAGAGNPC